MMVDEQKNVFDGNRIIYMGGEFNEHKAEMVVAKMLMLECMNPSKDILLFIDSYGGVVDSFVTIHDTMKLLRCDVATICVGKAMSCGQLLLVSGAKGKRFISPNSRVMIHEFTAANYGKLTDIEISVNENKRLQKVVWENLNLKYTKLTKDQLTKMRGRDTFLTAKECVKHGFVDHITTSPNVLYKNIDI
jgi:ATP-dependent Clp protease protease subunit